MQARSSMLLARCLPHPAARRLGAAFGRLGTSGHGHALTNLRTAFPDLGARRIAQLARDALAHRRAIFFDCASACRFDARALCQRLTLDGWDYLNAAENQQRGLLVLGAGFGSWQIAALSVALYKGPLETFGPCQGDPFFARLATGFGRRGDRRLIGELAGGSHPSTSAVTSRRNLAAERREDQAQQQLETCLRATNRFMFRIDQPSGHGETIAVPFLGQTIQAEMMVAKASFKTGTPVVPIFCSPRSRGGWSVEVRAPIQPESDARTLTTRYVAAVESEVRRQPELWLGWWAQPP